MDAAALRSFRDHLAYEDRLPFAWQPMPATMSATWLARLNESDQSVLGVIAALEEHRSDASEDNGAVGQELQRVDAKLNLLLELVNRLLAREQSLPDDCAVRFNAYGIEWDAAAAAPAVDSEGIAMLHLDACRALPLQLPVRIVESVAVDASTTRVAAVFTGVAESVQQAIERFVFRQHRRQVAEQRQSAR